MERLMMECAARAALIALATAAILPLLRVRSAAARHVAWTGVLIWMLLLPAALLWGPRASFQLLPPLPDTPIAEAPISLPVQLISTAVAAPASGIPARQWNWPAAIYLAGAGLLLARLALGTLRARALMRRAVNWEGVLTSADCTAPVTVGWIRPVILFPENWREWGSSQLAAVLSHEGEHIRRRDGLIQWLALLNRAIFWFHPLAWWLERKLDALAEEACDAAVLARGHDPREYSACLLEMARSVAESGMRLRAIGMAMPGSALPRRIRRILASNPAPRLTRARAVAMTFACLSVSALFAAASVDREASIPEPPLPPAAPAAPVQKTSPEGELRYKSRRLLVLYFDLDSLDADSHVRAIAAGSRFIETQMQPADLASIMTSHAGQVKVMEDFTDDHEKLLRDIDYFSGFIPQEFSIREPLDGLRAATRLLTRLPQKKALIYFSNGNPAAAASQEEIQSLTDSARQANVAFYPIDISAPRAVRAGDSVSVEVAGEPNFSGKYPVGPDGLISFPLLGDIKAAGLTPTQLEAAIASRLAAHLRTPKVTITVGK